MGKRKDALLDYLTVIPVVDTLQVANMFFSECNSPSKRASEFLVGLKNEKVIEGKRREMGETKVWRLTREAKKELGITKRSVPLNIKGIDHILSVGNFYIELKDQDDLDYFQFELREEFKGSDGKRKKYCPDSFFIYNNKPFFLEYQRSPLSSTRWAEKWKYGTDFITNKHYENGDIKGLIEETPTIVVVSNQNEHVIKTGADKLNIKIIRKSESFVVEEMINNVFEEWEFA